MKILIGKFILCGGVSENEHQENISFSDRQLIQIREYLRGKAAAPADRGNSLITYTFTVTRQHDDLQVAEEYILLHSAAIPRTGDVLFECEGMTGEKRQLKLTDGVRTEHHAIQIGVSTIHTYTLQGGSLQ